MGGLREVAASFVVPDPAGVAIRDRLRVSEADAAVLTEVGVYLGSLPRVISRDAPGRGWRMKRRGGRKASGS
ncbi:hypothetical protein [Streptomyces canus]|uniref:hypothetical protein n=1 Tax=Streptomyces canus TaxID=58343 RepID=UPI003870B994